MNTLNENTVTEAVVPEAEMEIAVPIIIQQKASLYAISSVLSGTRIVQNKKKMKKVTKQLKQDIIKAVGPTIGKEIMNANKWTVQNHLEAVNRVSKSVTNENPEAGKRVVSQALESLYNSYKIGLEKVLKV